MRDDIEAYVQTCLVCQQDKMDHQLPAGLLELLPATIRPWESVSINFIKSLPKSEGYGLSWSLSIVTVSTPLSLPHQPIVKLTRHLVSSSNTLWSFGEFQKVLWETRTLGLLDVFGRISLKYWGPILSSQQASTHKQIGKLSTSMASSRCTWGTAWELISGIWQSYSTSPNFLINCSEVRLHARVRLRSSWDSSPWPPTI